MAQKTTKKTDKTAIKATTQTVKATNSTTTQYQIVLVKPYVKDGEKRFGYTRIGVAFRKNGGDLIDLKLDLFPVITQGAFIQLRPVGSVKRKAA